MVTIRVEKVNWNVDMELPVRMKIRDLKIKMLDALKMYDEERFFKVSSINIFLCDKELSGEVSLADYQIWDGSIVDIKCE